MPSNELNLPWKRSILLTIVPIKPYTSHQRHKSQKRFANNQLGESELGQYLDRLLAKAIVSVAKTYQAASIVVPKLKDMRELNDKLFVFTTLIRHRWQIIWHCTYSKARDEDWTRDLTLTKGVLYHWATKAYGPSWIWTSVGIASGFTVRPH